MRPPRVTKAVRPYGHQFALMQGTFGTPCRVIAAGGRLIVIRVVGRDAAIQVHAMCFSVRMLQIGR